MAKSWVYIILAAVAGMIFTTFLSEIVFSNQYEAKKYLSEMQSASGAQTASFYQESRMKTGKTAPKAAPVSVHNEEEIRNDVKVPNEEEIRNDVIVQNEEEIRNDVMVQNEEEIRNDVMVQNEEEIRNDVMVQNEEEIRNDVMVQNEEEIRNDVSKPQMEANSKNDKLMDKIKLENDDLGAQYKETNSTNGSVEDIGLYEGAEADLLRVFAYHNKTITKVFYNRVPKCGSTTVTSVIGSVAKRNKLNHHVSGLWTIIHLYTEDKKKRFIREFNWQKKPLVYDRHFHFFDFTKFGEEQPVYINVLRDPLESFVSRWYFNTRPGGWKSKQNKYATFDDCMAANCSEVTKHGASIISNMAYICGHDPVCITGSDASVAVTKQNVMKHFSVIGLTEELEGFFELLDYLHPNIFKGVNQEYKNRVSKANSVRNKGKNKKPLKPVTVSRMMALLKYEYEVYHFIKQRYYLMYDRLQKLKQS